MILSVGEKLGPYEIVAPIGAGGMGEVYRARDTKLDREVAIKVLPAMLAQDPERLARFEREAKVLASLNHPNIAQIYGIEELSTGRALVMELVPGEPLRGLLTLETALHFAKQIADALEAAHERGIIHRDVKPANVMVTPAGVVKVLDFGLAAVAQDPASGSADPTNSPTLTMRATQAGTIMGTAAYMAPEQARGKSVDKRADIWAFGVVLYEMLAGKQLFRGDTVSDILAAVLKEEPDFQQVPMKVRPLLQRCLQKDPKKRLRDIGDWMLLLEDAPKEARSAPKSLPWIAAAVVLALALGSVSFVHFRETPPAPPAPTRFQILAPPNARFGVQMSLSPDGRMLAFTATNATEFNSIWVRPLDSLDAKPLPNARDGQPFFWSPDSRFIAYASNTKLMKTDISTGSSQVICDAPHGVVGGAWNREGTIIFGQNPGGLMKVSDRGGVAVPLTTVGGTGEIFSDELPSFLPDGRHFIYTHGASTLENNPIYLSSLDAKPGQEKLLMNSRLAVMYVPSPDPEAAHLLFMRERTLLAQTFDPIRLELTGAPVPIAEDVGSFLVHGLFSASSNGVMAYRKGIIGGNLRLAWFDRTGKEIGFVGAPSEYAAVAISPDQRRVAFSRRAPGNEDLWLLDLERSTTTRFTSNPAPDESPAWSPDGSRIAYVSGRDLYQKPSGGDAKEELLVRSEAGTILWDWSHDGKFLIYSRPDPKNRMDLWLLPMQGDHKPEPFLATEFYETQGQFSPDVHWVAYSSDESGTPEVYVQPFGSSAGGGGKVKISEGGGTHPRWRRDGKELFYISGSRRVMAVDVTTTPTFKAGVPKLLFETRLRNGNSGPYPYDVTADGKRFLIETVPIEAEEAPITIVTNWQADLKK
jgi:serine/threonine protein kinase